MIKLYHTSAQMIELYYTTNMSFIKLIETPDKKPLTNDPKNPVDFR